jgi:hypothetical protein
LSQAIYIYDQAGIATIKPTTLLSKPPANTTIATPILVFWKRQQIKNAVPFNSAATATKPSECKSDPDQCNDAYVLSLVAYYQFTGNDPTWCQPSGATCPTRIARYEIRDGVKNPSSLDPKKPYYHDTDANEYAPDPAFNLSFDISKPLENVINAPVLQIIKYWLITSTTAKGRHPQAMNVLSLCHSHGYNRSHNPHQSQKHAKNTPRVGGQTRKELLRLCRYSKK